MRLYIAAMRCMNTIITCMMLLIAEHDGIAMLTWASHPQVHPEEQGWLPGGAEEAVIYSSDYR